MADYTSTDLANVKAAILALATGQRAVRVQIGEKSAQYAEVDFSKLEALKVAIEGQLGSFSYRTYAKNGGRGA